jgi:hypothetical protein
VRFGDRGYQIAYPHLSRSDPSSNPLVPGEFRLHNLTYMHTSPENDYPRLCVEVGLACETCVGETARQLATVCKGLKGKMIGQMFVQIYPRPACARMHSHFAESYRQASSGEVASLSEAGHMDVDSPAIPRRGPAPERRRIMVAVA